MIQTIADTILWMAEERIKQEKRGNLNSTIHSIGLEISKLLMIRMKEENEKNKRSL